jgi:hypothetical protein
MICLVSALLVLAPQDPVLAPGWPSPDPAARAGAHQAWRMEQLRQRADENRRASDEVARAADHASARLRSQSAPPVQMIPRTPALATETRRREAVAAGVREIDAWLDRTVPSPATP